MKSDVFPFLSKLNTGEFFPYLIPIAGACLGFFLFIRDIDQPWIGIGDGDGALFSSIARNYLRFGVIELRLGQLTTFEAPSLPSGQFYLHHPPLFPLLVAASFSLFGESEFSARLVSVLCTLGTAALLFSLLKKSAGIRTAILGIFFFATYPSTIFFGRKPGYEALTLFFILLALWCYRKYEENPSRGNLSMLIGAISGGAASDWAAYLLPPTLVLHHLVTRGTRLIDRNLLAGLVFAPLAVLALFLTSIYVVDKTSLMNLLYQGLAYTGLFSTGDEISKQIVETKIHFSMKEYLLRLIKHFDTGFGLISAMLTALGLVFIQRNKSLMWLISIMLVVGLGISVVFWRSLYFHLWWLHLLAAPMAMLSAVAVNEILVLADSGKAGLRSTATANVGIVAGVALPVLAAMVFNVWQLGSIQFRVLPAGYIEKPEFIPEFARILRDATNAGDRILTNLSAGEWDPYRRILPYYARRKIIPKVVSVNEVLRLVCDGSESERRFYFWWHGAGGEINRSLISWLYQNQKYVSSVDVQGQKFDLFELDNCSASASFGHRM